MASANPLTDSQLKEIFKTHHKLGMPSLFRNGNPKSQFYVGWAYENGKGTEINLSKAIRWYLRAAEQGYNTEAYECLGKLYQQKEDYEKALHYFEKAAVQGSPTACYNVAQLYQEGLGVSQNKDIAMNWYLKSANQGSASAQYALAEYYDPDCLDLNSTTKNEEKAFESYYASACQGYAASFLKVANRYYEGRGIQKDWVKALEWFLKAKEDCSSNELYRIAQVYEIKPEVKDYKKALEYYQKACDKGNKAAWINIGQLHEAGLGVKQECGRALEYYQQSLSEGNKGALSKIGQLYEVGLDVKQDYFKARDYYQKAASEGSLDAQYKVTLLSKTLEKIQDFSKHLVIAEEGVSFSQCKIGDYYLYGGGENINFNKALAWYQKAAEKEDPIGLNGVGECYLNGYGVKITLEGLRKAIELFQASALTGCYRAELNLAYCHQIGLGVPKNEDKMQDYYTKALEHLSQDAKAFGREVQYLLARLYFHGLGGKETFKKAFELAQKSAEEGHALAQLLFAKIHRIGEIGEPNHEAAWMWHQVAMAQKHPYAFNEMGRIYASDELSADFGIHKNYTTALDYYLKSAECEQAGGETSVGEMYETGWGVEKSDSIAEEWYQKAAERGHLPAYLKMADLYAKSEEAENKDKKSLEWYQKAADRGSYKGCLKIAEIHLKGLGVAQDVSKAIAYYEKASEADASDKGGASFALGNIYKNGVGVASNFIKASEWYQKAKELGCQGAEETLKEENFLTQLKKEKEEEAQIQSEVSKRLEIERRVKEAQAKEAINNIDNAIVKREKFEPTPRKKEFLLSSMIDYNEIVLNEELGRGGFGVVYKAIWRHSVVAVKKLLINKISEDSKEEFEKETSVMASLRAPNIVQFYGYSINPYSIVMEHMPKGSLFEILRSSEDLSWAIRIKIALDIARGLAFLHQENIIHQDIKSLNVLIDENHKAKLTDFGLSKVKHETQSTSIQGGVAGTLAWIAPEVAMGEAGCNKKSDIYSLGITLWELVSRAFPFKKVAKPSLIPIRASQGYRDEIPADCPSKLTSLIKKCWDNDPQNRPEAGAIAHYLQSNAEDFTTFLIAYPARSYPGYQNNQYSEKNQDAAPAFSAYQGNLVSSIKNTRGP